MATSATVQAPMNRPGFDPDDEQESSISIAEILAAIRANLLKLILWPVAAGLLAFGGASLMKPIFTANTSFMPPQQAQSAAASALASLGSLASLTGGGGMRSSADQYVALMQSVTIADRLIDQFKLMDVYEAEFRIDARAELKAKTRFSIGKKDGLISIQVDDTSPKRAADIANRYVDELRLLTDKLAVTEAQQRRMFFEAHLQQTRNQLAQAQRELQASGFNAGAMKAEPKAAVEAYARLRAEVAAAEITLTTLRASLVDSAPEIQQQLAMLGGLRGQLAKAEAAAAPASESDYVGKYREFKYQESLFDMYARQFELARVDEGREGGLIQVVDPATPPEKKSKPRRALIALGGAGIALAGLLIFIYLRLTSRPGTPKTNASQDSLPA